MEGGEEDRATQKHDISLEVALEAGPSKGLPKTKKTFQHLQRPKGYIYTKLRRERCEKIRGFLQKQSLATGLSFAHVVNQSLSRCEVKAKVISSWIMYTVYYNACQIYQQCRN